MTRDDLIDFIRQSWVDTERDGIEMFRRVNRYFEILTMRAADLKVSDDIPTKRAARPRAAYSPSRRSLWLNRAAINTWFGNKSPADANGVFAFYDGRDFGRHLASLLDGPMKHQAAKAFAIRGLLDPQCVLIHGVVDGVVWFGARTLDEIVQTMVAHGDVFPLGPIKEINGNLVRNLSGRQRAFLLQQRVESAETSPLRILRATANSLSSPSDVLSAEGTSWSPPLTLSGRPDDDDKKYWRARLVRLPESVARVALLEAAMRELNMRLDSPALLWQLLGYPQDVLEEGQRVLEREGWNGIGGIADGIVLRSIADHVLAGRPESFADHLIDRVLEDGSVLRRADRLDILENYLIWVPQRDFGSEDTESRNRTSCERARRIRIVRALLDGQSAYQPIASTPKLLRTLMELGDLREVVRRAALESDGERRANWLDDVSYAASSAGDMEAILDILATARSGELTSTTEYLLGITLPRAGRRIASRLRAYWSEHPERKSIIEQVLLSSLEWARRDPRINLELTALATDLGLGTVAKQK